MTTYQKRPLLRQFAVLGGPQPPDAFGFTSERLQILWNCGDEGWSDPGQHFHTDSNEVFIVFWGSIELDVGDKRIVIEAGEMCFFPSGVFHGVVKVHTPIDALVIRAPAIPDKVIKD